MLKLANRTGFAIFYDGRSGVLYLRLWILVSSYSGNLEKHCYSGVFTRVRLKFKLLYLNWRETWKSYFL